MKKRASSGRKLYIVRSYVMAKNAAEAIRKAKKKDAEDAYVSDEWKQGQVGQLTDAIGYDDGIYVDEEED